MHARFIQVIMTAASLVGVAGLVALAMWMTSDSERSRRGARLAEQLASLEAENRALEAKALRLRREITNLAAEGDAIDRYAHGSLGMGRPGERVYLFDTEMARGPRPGDEGEAGVQ